MPVDYVDYTLLKRKGILKINEEPKQDNVKLDSGGFVDFTSAQAQSINSSSDLPAPTSPSLPSFPAGDMFGFMDMGAIASSRASTPSPSSSTNITGSSDSDVSTLKVKIDDIEYKISRLMEKLNAIEEKFR